MCTHSNPENNTLGIHVDCRHRNLTEIPSNLPPDLSSLDLSGNWITDLDWQVLQIYGNLTTLRLQDNRISRLPEGVQQGHPVLQELDLEGNVLQNLSSASLNHLPRLQKITLKTADVTSDVFSSTESLEHVTLTLEADLIPGDIFGGWRRELKTIELVLPNIRSLPHDLFHQLLDLMKLDMRARLLEELSPFAFRGLVNLQSVHLEVDRLEGMDTLPVDVFNVQAGLCSDLGQTEEECRRLQQNSSLTDISIVGIARIPEGIFSSVTSLEKLSLCQTTQGLEASLRALGQLTLLNLSSNGISSENTQVFDIVRNLPQLRVLNMSDNMLAGDITDHFDGLSSLEILDVSKNFIRFINRTAISALSPSLRFLNLDGNDICGDLSYLDTEFPHLHVEKARACHATFFLEEYGSNEATTSTDNADEDETSHSPLKRVTSIVTFTVTVTPRSEPGNAAPEEWLNDDLPSGSGSYHNLESGESSEEYLGGPPTTDDSSSPGTDEGSGLPGSIREIDNGDEDWFFATDSPNSTQTQGTTAHNEGRSTTAHVPTMADKDQSLEIVQGGDQRTEHGGSLVNAGNFNMWLGVLIGVAALVLIIGTVVAVIFFRDRRRAKQIYTVNKV